MKLVPKDDTIDFLLTRRRLLAACCCAPLAGCQNESATVRYRVIAAVIYKGIRHEASTVMECRYTRVTSSLTGMGGSTRLYGEALIFDLPDGAGTFYILPYWRGKTGELNQFYEDGLLVTLGIKKGIGSLTDQDMDAIRTASGRKAFNYFGHTPAMIAFRDERDPKTILEKAYPLRTGSHHQLRIRYL